MIHPQPVSHTSSALSPALAALSDAEGKLREAAAKAAASGEYDALAVITRWAKTLQSLASETIDAAPLPPPSAGVAKRLTNKGNKARLPAGAPDFSRDGGMLVKTARSKKSKNEYAHRAPLEVVTTVAECFSDWRPSRKLLTGEQLLDAYAKKKGGAVSYQVYAALGWFGQLGLVRRHGRSGYSVPRPNTIIADVQNAWNSLGQGQQQ